MKPAESWAPARKPRLAPFQASSIGVDAAAIVLCAIVAVRRGQDINFDQLSYHYWYAELLVHGDLAQADPALFIGRYLNPLVQVPWYLATNTLPPRWAGGAMGALHGLAFVVARRANSHILGDAPPVAKLVISTLAALFGFTSAMALSELGTSLSDLVVAIPVLLALLVLVRPGAVRRRIILVGLLMGAALGLKLTAAPFVVAMFIALAVRRIPLQVVLVRALTYATATLAGFLITGGWWAVSLARQFGNPMFPFFNNIFRSKLYPNSAFHDDRFTAGLGDALRYPVYLAQGTRRTSEALLRDQRWLLLAGLATCCFAVIVWRRLRGGVEDPQRGLLSREPGDLFAPYAVVAFFTTSWLLWIYSFAISRYLVPLEVAGGILALVLLHRLARAHLAVTASALTLGLILCLNSSIVPNWGHKSWQQTWYGTDAKTFDVLPRGAAVVHYVGNAPLTYLLSTLPSGRKGIVVVHNFFGSQMAERVRQTLASAPEIWVLKDEAGIEPMTLELDLSVNESDCLPVPNHVKPARLCRASIVSASGTR